MSSFSISPAVDGKSTWNLSTDGNLVLPSSGVWTITPTSNFDANTKVWGAGGGNYSGANGGAGGAAFGKVSFTNGTSYKLFVGSPGSGASGRGGGAGGAASGVLITSGEVEVLIAGGGGGSCGSSGRRGGAGGGENGQQGDGSGGYGGSQSGAGSGGSGSRRTGSSGSGTNGGDGSGASNSYGPGTSGISGKYNGGYGRFDGGDQGGGGGGGGHFGGGGGGGDAGGFGGGGGSGYYNPSYVTNATLYTGSSTTPGNDSDADRGSAGNGETSGKIVLILASGGVGGSSISGPAVTVNVANSSVTEASTSNIVYTFTRANGANLITTGNITVEFMVGGNAVFNTDYSVTGANTFGSSNGTITIVDGNHSVNLVIDPIDDYDVGNTVFIRITPNNATPGYTISNTNYDAYITNDDLGIYPVGGAGNTQLEISALPYSSNAGILNVGNISITTVTSYNVQNIYKMAATSEETVNLKIDLVYTIDFPNRISFNRDPTPQNLPDQYWK